MSATCGHVSCARREQQVAVLIKAALDASVELQKRTATITDDGARDQVHQVVDRINDACGQLMPRKFAGCKRVDGGADCYASDMNVHACDNCNSAIWVQEVQVPA